MTVRSLARSDQGSRIKDQGSLLGPDAATGDVARDHPDDCRHYLRHGSAPDGLDAEVAGPFSPAGQPALHGGSRSTWTGRCWRTGPTRDRPCSRSGNGVTSCRSGRRAITGAFAGLRGQGTAGLPRNLAVLHSPLLKAVAVRYWARIMRSPTGELCFAGHSRHAEAEMRALGDDTAARITTSPALTELLRPLAGLTCQYPALEVRLRVGNA